MSAKTREGTQGQAGVATAPQATPAQTEMANRLGLTGPSGSRRRGAMLRRLLAAGDWVAIFAALCVATALTSTTDVGQALLGRALHPGLAAGAEAARALRQRPPAHPPQHPRRAALADLGQRPGHDRARRPAGAEPGRRRSPPKSAIVVGIGALLACFVARAVLRFVWQRLTGVAIGIVVGPGERWSTWSRGGSPPIRRRGCSWSATSRPRATRTAAPRCRGWARSKRSRGWRASTTSSASSSAEQEMSERDAEHLIEECKAAGLGLTFLPQHYGLLGPGIELNRLAELPVLDFRFSDPPRSTLALKRGAGHSSSRRLMLTLLSPLLAAIALLILLDSGTPVFFRQTPRRQGRRAVHDAEVPHHGHRRRGAAGRAGRPREARRARLQDRRRPADHPRRARCCAAPASTSCRS